LILALPADIDGDKKEFDLIALKQLIRESHYLHTFAAREHEWEAISVQR